MMESNGKRPINRGDVLRAQYADYLNAENERKQEWAFVMTFKQWLCGHMSWCKQRLDLCLECGVIDKNQYQQIATANGWFA
jgi:hypothetical protein